MCPTDAFTTKALPRYFLIVRALAGDSTTRSDLPVAALSALADFLAAPPCALALVVRVALAVSALVFLAAGCRTSFFLALAMRLLTSSRRGRGGSLPPAPRTPTLR